ncbi:MAG: hypothetical protein V4676_07875 [Bacteroidota bacterium]
MNTYTIPTFTSMPAYEGIPKSFEDPFLFIDKKIFSQLQHVTKCAIELPTVQECDATDDDRSNVAG